MPSRQGHMGANMRVVRLRMNNVLTETGRYMMAPTRSQTENQIFAFLSKRLSNLLIVMPLVYWKELWNGVISRRTCVV